MIVTCKPRETAKESKSRAWTQAYVDQRNQRHGMTDNELRLTWLWTQHMLQLEIGKVK